MQRFRVDLKTFFGSIMPNQCCHADLWVGFFWQETPNLNDPVLPYYMITMKPINCKITNFSLYFFLCFL